MRLIYNSMMDFTLIQQMNLKALIIFVSAISVPVPLMAQDGSSTYSFLDIPASTQAMALGGANISVIDDDIMMTGQNPALLGPEIESRVGLNYMHYMGSGNFAGVKYGMGAGEHGAWAAGIRYLNYGSVTATNPDGSENGTFSPQDMVIDGTYSHDFSDYLRGGITLKFLYSNYEEYSAIALGADFGLNYYNSDRIFPCRLSYAIWAVRSNVSMTPTTDCRAISSSAIHKGSAMDHSQYPSRHGISTSGISPIIRIKTRTEWKKPN